jgi:uncharacterized protein
MRKRLYFEIFYPIVEDTSVKRAIVLMGPRRVGKTVLMFHAIDRLIEKGYDPKKICFIGIDNPININLGLEDMLDLALTAVKKEHLNGFYVFFDEIQYLKDWERQLKSLVEMYPNTKFIVSGFAAAALKMQSGESGARRFTNFMLPPLTFHEYIYLKGLDNLVQTGKVIYNSIEIPFFNSHDINELNKEFFQYLSYGGYPEVVFSEMIQSDMGRYVKSDIVDKVLLRYLPSLYGIRDIQELNRFFNYLAYITCREFSFEKICKESAVQKDTIKKYLECIEAAILIKVIHKVDENANGFKRVTAFKVYLTNPSLRTAMLSPVQPIDNDAENMVETAIFSQWMHCEQLDLKYTSWKMG